MSSSSSFLCEKGKKAKKEKTKEDRVSFFTSIDSLLLLLSLGREKSEKRKRKKKKTQTHQQPGRPVVGIKHKHPVARRRLQDPPRAVGREPPRTLGVAQQHRQEDVGGDLLAPSVVDGDPGPDVRPVGGVDEGPRSRVEGGRRGVVGGEDDDVVRGDAVSDQDVVGLLALLVGWLNDVFGVFFVC